MSERSVDYEQYLRNFGDGSIWLLKEDAIRLGAGYLPVRDDKTITTKLRAPNNQAELNERTLLGAFNDDRLTIERPRTLFVERLGTFDGDGFIYVEAEGFVNWLRQYITLTLATEIPSPDELERAAQKVYYRAAAHPSATSEAFESLTLALEGQFDKPLEELPEALRGLVERDLTLHRLWDRLAPEQRQERTAQWDTRNDPASKQKREQQWQFYAKLYDELQKAREKLAEWESVTFSTASDLELKESKVEKWQREVTRLELQEKNAQATTFHDTDRLRDDIERAEMDGDLKALAGAMGKVSGHAKLCRAFGYGERSFNAVTRKLKEYNRRFPDDPIQFKRIEGKTPWLYYYECWKIIAKLGICSGKRPKKKT